MTRGGRRTPFLTKKDNRTFKVVKAGTRPGMNRRGPVSMTVGTRTYKAPGRDTGWRSVPDIPYGYKLAGNKMVSPRTGAVVDKDRYKAAMKGLTRGHGKRTSGWTKKKTRGTKRGGGTWTAAEKKANFEARMAAAEQYHADHPGPSQWAIDHGLAAGQMSKVSPVMQAQKQAILRSGGVPIWNDELNRWVTL